MPNPEIPLIGQYSNGPQKNAPRSSAPLQSKPDAVVAVEQAEATLTEEKKKYQPPTKKEKAEMYAKSLEEVGLDISTARTIIDAMLEKGAYEEDALIGGKIHVTFRSRDYGDVHRAMHFLEVENPQYPQAINDLISKYNLAASLKRFNKDVFEFPDRRKEPSEKIEEAFHKRLDYVTALATPLVQRLMELLVKFDMKVSAALSDGAPEDF